MRCCTILIPDETERHMNTSKLNRTLHRWGAIIIVIPITVIIVTGIMLQFKKRVAWIQPPTQTGSSGELTIGFDRILEIARSVPAAGVRGWEQIDRLDVRPGKGMVKVRCSNGWEIQIDTKTGAILQVSPRRSDLIESIHDGSYFHPGVKLWVFFPTALIFAGLVISGIYLFLLPSLAKRNRRATG